MTTILSAGGTYALVQNQVYVLPPTVVRVHSTDALEVSVDNTNFVLTAATTTGLELAASFVRCTTSTTAQCAVKRL
jgi:hypothetical protein